MRNSPEDYAIPRNLTDKGVARKIGYDKQVPLCDNCLRTGRSCEGYGLKVQWPKLADGRRTTCEWESRARETKNLVTTKRDVDAGGKTWWWFLNTTYERIMNSEDVETGPDD
jgi:hypothetical protein